MTGFRGNMNQHTTGKQQDEVPLYDSYVIFNAVKRRDYGGRDLTVVVLEGYGRMMANSSKKTRC